MWMSFISWIINQRVVILLSYSLHEFSTKKFLLTKLLDFMTLLHKILKKREKLQIFHRFSQVFPHSTPFWTMYLWRYVSGCENLLSNTSKTFRGTVCLFLFLFFWTKNNTLKCEVYDLPYHVKYFILSDSGI